MYTLHSFDVSNVDFQKQLNCKTLFIVQITTKYISQFQNQRRNVVVYENHIKMKYGSIAKKSNISA